MASDGEKLDALITLVAGLVSRMGRLEARLDKVHREVAGVANRLELHWSTTITSSSSSCSASGDGDMLSTVPADGASSSDRPPRSRVAATGESGASESGSQTAENADGSTPSDPPPLAALDLNVVPHLDVGASMEVDGVDKRHLRFAIRVGFAAEHAAEGPLQWEPRLMCKVNRRYCPAWWNASAAGGGMFGAYDWVVSAAGIGDTKKFGVGISGEKAFVDTTMVKSLEIVVVEAQAHHRIRPICVVQCRPPPVLPVFIPVHFKSTNGALKIRVTGLTGPKTWGLNRCVTLTAGDSFAGVADEVTFGVGWSSTRVFTHQVGVDLKVVAVLFDAGGGFLGLVDAQADAPGLVHTGNDGNGRKSGINEGVLMRVAEVDPLVARVVIAVVPPPGDGSAWEKVTSIAFAAEADRGYSKSNFCSFAMTRKLLVDGILIACTVDIRPEAGRAHSLSPRWVVTHCPDAQAEAEAIRTHVGGGDSSGYNGGSGSGSETWQKW